MAGRAEWSELDDISVELKESLNIPNLRPFLRVRHLLTEAELEQVQTSPANPRDQAIDRLVSILKTKGPRHAEVFLEVLKLSLEQDDFHLGHEYLSERLTQVICDRKGENEIDALAADHIPIHSRVTNTDSGLDMTGSANSSQETGSPRSTLSELMLSGGSAYNESYYRAQTIRGLERLENEPANRQGLDQRHISNLRHKIISDTSNITSCFAIMVVGVYRLLKQKKAPVDEVKIVLQFLGCHPATSKEKTTLFSGSDEISESKDLASIIECLRKYSSWYNYRLMKVVAEHFAGEEGKKLISDYEDDLRKHYVTLIAYQCPDFSLERGVPPGHTRLIVKVDWDYRSTNLQDIATFQASLADILELEPYVFQLRTVEEGCVRFDWSIPAALESYVCRMMVEKQECLKERRVLSVEITSSRILIDKDSLPVKSRTSSNASSIYPRTQRKTALSQSSSIASILDVPMSTMEAELLSLYDSGGSIDGDALSSKYSPTFSIVEDTTRYPPTMSEGETQNVATSPVGERFTPDEPSVSTYSPITREFCSENDLLSDFTHCTLRYGRDGLSLPDLVRAGVQAATPNRAICGTKICRRGPSIMRSLRKLPMSILNRLRSSRQNNREGRKPNDKRPDSPLRMLEFQDEPRRPGFSRNIPSPKKFDEIISDNTTFSLSAIPNVYEVLPGVNAETTVHHNEIGAEEIDFPLLPLVNVRRDSAVPSSPVSTQSLDTVSMGINSDRNPYRDSGVGASLNSTHSGNNKPYARPYARQTSSDSTDTVSVSSYSTVPSSSKRNSYSSHYYVNLDFPIHEEDSHDATTQNQYQPPERKYPPEKYELQNRSHSHGEEYYRRVHPNSRLPLISPHSSGYSSIASSLAQGVDMWPSQSQESLSGSVKSSAFSTSQRSMGPFASRPGRAKVDRSSSLKSTATYRVHHST